MKKILLFIILLLPITVNADAKITNHLIDAEIEIAGGLRVRELIIFDGNIKDYSRNINYKMVEEEWLTTKTGSSIYNGYSIENMKVSVIKAPIEIDFNSITDNVKDYINELDPKSKSSNFYTKIKNSLGYTVNIHHDSKEEKVAFFIEYIVSNVIVVHNDILELNYTFKNIDINSENTLIRVIIPYATTSPLYNYWVHGPSTGSLNEVVNSSKEKLGIYAHFPNLKSEVNIRMTLPKEQVGIDVYLNKSNKEALKEIKIQEETKLKTQNNDVKVLKVIKYILIGVSIAYVVGSLILIKYHDKSIFNLYLVLGLIITIFNFVFKYHIIYIYFIIFIPIIIKLITNGKKNKKRQNKKKK